MPLYEFESPKGQIFEDLRPADDCPDVIHKLEDGKMVPWRKRVSGFSVPSSVREIIEQEISGDREEQERRFFAPDPRNGKNPKTGKWYSDAERLASGDPKVKGNKGTRKLIDKKAHELRGAV